MADISNLKERAESYLSEGKLELAKECYLEAIALSPNQAQLYHKLGEILSLQEKWQEAVDAYREAVKINPNFALAHQKLGDALMKLENWDDAICAYSRTRELKPDLPWINQKLGDVFVQKGEVNEAVACYKKALELKPEAWGVRQKLCDILLREGRLDEAIAACHRAMELNPDLLWAYYKLGNALEEKGEINEAVAWYGRILEKKSNNYWFEKLMSALEKLGRLDKLKDLYLKAMEMNPKELMNYKGLIKIYIKEKNWEQALAYSLQILKIMPENFYAYLSIANVLEKQGNFEGSELWKFNFILPDYLLKKYCNFTKTSAVKCHSESSIDYQKIYPETQINLLPSISINKKAQHLFKQKKAKFPEAFVALVPDARAWGDKRNSAVITSDNKLVKDISTGVGELILSSDRLPSFDYLDGTVAFFSVCFGESYYHWMFDVLPRFHLLDCSGIKISDLDKIVTNKLNSNFHFTTLNKLEIPQEKILDGWQLHLKAKRLVVPSLSGRYRCSKWACNFLRGKFLRDSGKNLKSAERLYISRKLASRRRVVNEEEVVEFLDKLGFVSVVLESMSVEEQAWCLAGAKVVVAPHGGGLTNLVFCNPGTKAIEIFSPDYIPNCYWQLSNVCGLDRYYLIGEDFKDDSSNVNGCENILVSLKKLSKLMNLAGVF
jgi:tetratricopeptide (TPR) repeat protein